MYLSSIVGPDGSNSKDGWYWLDSGNACTHQEVLISGYYNDIGFGILLLTGYRFGDFPLLRK